MATVRSGTSRISQVVLLVAVVMPPLGVLAAIGVLWEVAFHASDLAIMVAMYVVCGVKVPDARQIRGRRLESPNVAG